MKKQDSLQKEQTGYYNQTRSEMLAFVPSTAKSVLEIGCGNGEFSRAIQQKFGAEVWGVEPNTSAAAQANKHLNKVLCGSIENNIDNLPNSHFDCICMNDVIEHLLDPWQVLLSLRIKLRSKGVVIASIPNVRHYENLSNLLFNSDWRYTEAGTLDRSHLRFFTPKSMQRLFEEAGYSIQQITGIRGSRKFKLKILSFLSAGNLWDIRYSQFAVVASPH